MTVATTDSFEQSEAWREVQWAIENFASAYEVDYDVLITAVSETVNSIINGEE